MRARRQTRRGSAVTALKVTPAITLACSLGITGAVMWGLFAAKAEEPRSFRTKTGVNVVICDDSQQVADVAAQKIAKQIKKLSQMLF